MDLQQIIDDCLEWSSETFGNDNLILRKLYHLKKELNDELIPALESNKKKHPSEAWLDDEEILMEYVDCMILLTTSAAAYGINLKQLSEGMMNKLEINKQRKWGEPDENGVVEHIRS